MWSNGSKTGAVRRSCIDPTSCFDYSGGQPRGARSQCLSPVECYWRGGNNVQRASDGDSGLGEGNGH